MTAFKGITVLDLSRVLAGPYCGQLLASFGADVIKIEDLAGDEIRSWFPQRDGVSTNFDSVNAGKQAIVLNLKTPEARELLWRLAAQADVLIHSFLPDVADRLGVDYPSMQRQNPDLVYCCVSGYGTNGPLRNKPGYDLMLQAFTGVMTMTGEPDGGPMRTGTSAIDMSTGMLAFGGIAAALFARATGQCRGQEVRLSLLETGVGLLGYHLTNFLNAGFIGERGGSGVAHIVPYQAWQCSDGGWLLAGATNDAMFRRLCAAIERVDLAEDPRFRTASDRRTHRSVLVPMLVAHFASRDVAYWMLRLDEAGVPASPVHTIDQVVAHPQVLATEMVVNVAPEGAVPRHVPGVPIKMSATPGKVAGPPPGLGEHTESVLRRRLGLSTADLQQLRAAKAF